MSTITDEQRELLLEEMDNQSIPEHWQEVVTAAMVSQEHYMKMMNCLIENYHKDCSSMDLINTLNEIDDTMEVFH